MTSIEIQKCDQQPIAAGDPVQEKYKAGSGWKGLLLSAAAVVGQQLLRQWLRGSRKGRGGGGEGGRGRSS